MQKNPKQNHKTRLTLVSVATRGSVSLNRRLSESDGGFVCFFHHPKERINVESRRDPTALTQSHRLEIPR